MKGEAVGFHLYSDFRIAGGSELDGAGESYPSHHMKLDESGLATENWEGRRATP